MTTQHLKNWIKAQDADFTGCIQLGGINANAQRFLGVYPGSVNGRQHIAIGGPTCTTYDTMSARLLLRWGKSQPVAEEKAWALWRLFYGRTNFLMDSAAVYYVDPGQSPISLGKGADGIFEYVINLNIVHKKE